MSALKRIFSRAEWRFLGGSAVLAVALTLWFPFPSYFLVEAEVEQISVALDADSRLEWNLHQTELLPDEGPKALIDGQVSVRSKDPILFRRIEKGALKILLPASSELTVVEPGDLESRSLPVDRFPATLVLSPESGSALVLPIRGNVVVGRDPQYAQTRPERPVLLSGSVQVQARAIDGRAVVHATDQKMYMGDSLSFHGAANGNGLVRVSDSAGMQLFFAINARQALIQRFGSPKPVVVQPSVAQRIVADNVLSLVWSLYVFLAGMLFFRRSLLKKK